MDAITNRTSTILTITGITIVGGVIAYAIYFDHKRRNDVEFRKRIRSQKKKVERTAAEEKTKKAEASGVTPEGLSNTLKKVREEPLPSPDQREGYFMEEVAKAEQMALQGPGAYLESALSFYRALRVYPSQMELLMIYQKSVPEPILMIIMELYNLDVLSRINGYFDHFPPKSMNVAVQNTERKDAPGVQPKKQILVATKDFKMGEEIYKESPIVAVLDPDVQQKRTHCSHCLRKVEKRHVIQVESDPLQSIYCSKRCLSQAKIQSQNFLFGSEPPIPPEMDPQGMSENAKEDRKQAQAAFVEYLKITHKSIPLLVARIVALQVAAETAKLVPPGSKSPFRTELPEGVLGGEYTFFDHLERLRFLQMPMPEGEWKLMRDVLHMTMPGLEQFHTDERHAVFRGKMAYNAIGVCFAGGRDDKPVPMDRPENVERTRTPHGTSRQIGSGLYFVSSYIGHSCAPSVRPSFSSNNSELHLLATRDISKGEELTMSYVDVSQHSDETAAQARERRRYEIARGWRFACSCSRCEEGDENSRKEESDMATLVADGSRVEDSLTRHLDQETPRSG